MENKIIDIETTDNGTLQAQVVYTTTECCINEVKFFGNLNIIILITIPEKEKEKAKLTIEVYNNNVSNELLFNNFISFSCFLSEINNYTFDEILEDYIMQIKNNFIN